MPGFRWKMGDWVGGAYAVHQSYKPLLAMNLASASAWAGGEMLIQPRDTSNIEVNVGFEPDVVMFVSYRPHRANGGVDSQFAARSGGISIGAVGRGLGADEIAQFTGTQIIRGAFIASLSTWYEDRPFSVWSFDETPSGNIYAEILRLDLVSIDTDGFTLAQTTNLYDETDYVAYLAMKGNFSVGVFDTGDTVVSGTPGKPKGGVFQSVKKGHPDYESRLGNFFNHMTGFACDSGSQASIWGGQVATSWAWTTERWQDDAAITLCTAAAGSGFVGASLDQKGIVTDWWENADTVTIARIGGTATVTHTAHGFGTGQRVLISGANQGAYNGVQSITVTAANTYTYSVTGSPATPATGTITSSVGGIDIQWPVYDNIPCRVGIILTGESSDASVLETNWDTRPGGLFNDFADGSNYHPTLVTPDVVLMTGTNYNFDYTETDPFDKPRLPNQFGSGASAGLGWHVSPFIDGFGDAWGVHTFGNGVAELGHFANGGAQYTRNYIMAGQGANSNPPAYHQHSVNIIPNPVIVGLNYRYAERHAHVHRLHVNQSDRFIP